MSPLALFIGVILDLYHDLQDHWTTQLLFI